MSKLLILKGLPASGKTSYAKKLIEKDGGRRWLRVCRDDLREQMFNYIHSKPNEKLVRNVRDMMIIEGLVAGRDVIIDETNLRPALIDHYRDMTTSFNPDIEIKYFEKTLKQAIKDDLNRPRSVGAKVIRQMYYEFLAPNAVPYVRPEGKRKAIVVDIDGTLAHMVGRTPHEYHRVNEDVLDAVVASIVRRYYEDDYKVILLSGRNDGCREMTEEWLQVNDVPYDELFMRKQGDMRQDDIVKQELFDSNVRHDYAVEFIMDDRDQVVAMWRRLGLKVLQVAEGDF